jgi:hypothetical protein
MSLAILETHYCIKKHYRAPTTIIVAAFGQKSEYDVYLVLLSKEFTPFAKRFICAATVNTTLFGQRSSGSSSVLSDIKLL